MWKEHGNSGENPPTQENFSLSNTVTSCWEANSAYHCVTGAARREAKTFHYIPFKLENGSQLLPWCKNSRHFSKEKVVLWCSVSGVILHSNKIVKLCVKCYFRVWFEYTKGKWNKGKKVLSSLLFFQGFKLDFFTLWRCLHIFSRCEDIKII